MPVPQSVGPRRLAVNRCESDTLHYAVPSKVSVAQVL